LADKSLLDINNNGSNSEEAKSSGKGKRFKSSHNVKGLCIDIPAHNKFLTDDLKPKEVSYLKFVNILLIENVLFC
jgi:hypothetical protein